MKFCGHCQQEKPLAYFHHRGAKSNYRPSSWCKDCKNAQTRENYTYEKHRKKHLKRNHNITIEQYNTLFDSQNGSCSICRRHQSQLTKTLCVDHDHKTGLIRGLLCNECNQALGLLYDSISNLDRAKQYLIASAISAVLATPQPLPQSELVPNANAA